jgi:hypothetical protein
VDGFDDEMFQVYTVLLAVCKVNVHPLDVQWNGWLFEHLARETEQTRLTAEERLIG